jgi:hypothetical protein
MKVKLIYSKDLNLVNALSRNLLFLRLNLFIGLLPGAKKICAEFKQRFVSIHRKVK